MGSAIPALPNSIKINKQGVCHRVSLDNTNIVLTFHWEVPNNGKNWILTWHDMFINIAKAIFFLKVWTAEYFESVKLMGKGGIGSGSDVLLQQQQPRSEVRGPSYAQPHPLFQCSQQSTFPQDVFISTSEWPR